MEIEFDIDKIEQVAETILNQFPDQRCFAFFAEMGSGKTTIISALCRALGVKDNISSPTFSIINEYEIAASHQKVYHMDWYRLKNMEDAIEAGVQDILQQKDIYCFIEWPEIAPELLAPNTMNIFIQTLSSNVRKIKIG